MKTDLKERFSLADDGLDSPDLWAEAKRRAVQDRPIARGLDGAWAPDRHRLVTAAVAFAVFAAAAVFAWDLSHPDTAPEPGVDLGAELPEGWSELPAPPENRSAAATAWTGSQLIVWGGYEYVGSGEDPHNDGFVFDAAARRWNELPDSPLRGRSDAAAVWTGSELLVWGGWDGGFRDPPYFDDGAAFDPDAGTWRMLPDAPIGARTPFAVWTGRELIVWGSTDRFDRMRDGAAYDPTSDTWRRIADAPVDITDGSAVWTGREMIVFGAALDGSSDGDTATAIGAAYDPAANSWRELPPSDLSPQATSAEWLGGQLIAWDYEHTSAAYDLDTDAWRPLEDVPLSFAECYPKTTATTETVFGEFCGRTVAFSAEEGGWHRVPMPIPSDSRPPGCCWVHEPVTAGDVVLVPSHLYGKELEALERRMFVYNPPAMVRTDPRGEVLEPELFIPPTERDEDRIRMPITFPDGSEATVSYPIPLDLATHGIQPDVSYLWKENPPPRFPIRFLHDPDASIAEFVEGREPVGSVGPDRIEVWEARGNDVERRFWLRFELPSWTVLVSVRDAVTSAEDVAASLVLRETESGFPLALPSGPIELSQEPGEGEGPLLSIGSFGDPDIKDAVIQLWSPGCDRTSSGDLAPSKKYFSRCFQDRIQMNVTGDAAAVTDIARGVTVGVPERDALPFVPQAQVADGSARVAMTFPDGSEATLVYPAELDLAALGVQPDVSYHRLGDPETWFPIVFLHGRDASIDSFVDGSGPVPLAADGGIDLWKLSDEWIRRLEEQSLDLPDPRWVRFHSLQGWTVLVAIGHPDDAGELVANLTVHETPGGFPFVGTKEPIILNEGHSDAGGAQLAFGDRVPDPVIFTNSGAVVFFPHPCMPGRDISPSLGYGSSCTAPGDVFASVTGHLGFVRSVVEGVRIEDFREA